jgi:hypothetical protein
MQYQTEVIACRIRKDLKEEMRAISLNMQIHQSELLRSLIVGFIENQRGFEEDEMGANRQKPDLSSWESSY